jgi:BirA family biotin operon repressor/biotin-[acetyl-CoA-carboxylase] ligase
MPFDADFVRARLPGRRIEWHPSIPSTMPEAARLAAEAAPPGTVVGADEQTAGLGRKGHFWHSERESGLYVSIILRLDVKGDALPVVMLALGLAVREAITEVTGLAPDLRWPNDVLLGERKCAGILAQFVEGAVVAGIGVNVNHTAFPPEIAAHSTSLRIVGRRAYSREELLVSLLAAVDRSCTILSEEGSGAILSMFQHASSYAVGRRVRVEQDGHEITGSTVGLTPGGFLLVKQDNGKEAVILAGGVRPCS